MIQPQSCRTCALWGRKPDRLLQQCGWRPSEPWPDSLMEGLQDARRLMKPAVMYGHEGQECACWKKGEEA